LELIRDLPLLDAVINESMRILPPVPQQFRVATKDTALANFPVRSRTKVLISPFLTNRNPDLYPEPDCFKPERWSSIKPSSYEFFVFSAGPRACPGFWFGTSVLKVAIAAIMTRFHIVLAPNARIDYKVRLALSPNGNVPATLKRQDGAVTRSSIQGSIRNLVRFPN
jgi:cytochrome P450